MTTARHTCDSPEWYTPVYLIDAARAVMGHIDVDPASHPEAQPLGKCADRYYTEVDSGLERPWNGRVFINPPGGLVQEFWEYLLEEVNEGRTDQAIWIGYSVEQLQTLQSTPCGVTPLDFSFCIPKRRIAFVENAAKRAQREAKLRLKGKTPNAHSSPSHANYVTYIGERQQAFATVFGVLGQVVRP